MRHDHRPPLDLHRPDRSRGTVCYVLEAGRILLGWKQRGPGTGLANGFGGKLEPGERARDPFHNPSLHTRKRPMEIRNATASDAGLLARLNQHVHALHVAAAPDFFRTPSLAEATDAFHRLLEKETVLGYIAMEGEVPVGYLILVLKSSPANAFSRARRTLYLEQIGVEPAWQGRGIGKALVAWTRQVAREREIDRIDVESWAFNEKAQAFFQAQGFGPRMRKFTMRLDGT